MLDAKTGADSASLLELTRAFVARSKPAAAAARRRRWLVFALLTAPILIFLWPPGGDFAQFAAQLPIRLLVVSWILLVAFAVVFAHELGHAVAALCVGGGVRAFCVKPFVVYFSPLRVRLFLRPFPAGFVMPMPRRDIVPWRDAVVTAGGVIANGLTALAVYLWQPESMLWSQTAKLFVGLSIYSAIAALVPLWIGGGRTDGAWLIALARGQTRTGFYACTRLGPFVASGIRPRDWPPALTRELFTAEAKGPRGLFIRSLRFSLLLDTGSVEAAAEELRQGLSQQAAIGEAWPAVVATVAWFVAMFQRDAKSAREILALIPQRRRGTGFLAHRAWAAVHWADGDMPAALSEVSAARRAGRRPDMAIGPGDWERLATIEADASRALGRLAPA